MQRWDNKCKAFLGVVFEDGPPPFFLRFAMNSAALQFRNSALFENPKIKREKIEALKEANKIKNKMLTLKREPYHVDKPKKKFD